MSAHLDEIDHSKSHDNDDDDVTNQHSNPATGDFQHNKITKNGDPNEKNLTQSISKNVKKEWVKFEEDDDKDDDDYNDKINNSNGGVKRKIKLDTAITNPLSSIAATIDIPLDNGEQVNILSILL